MIVSGIYLRRRALDANKRARYDIPMDFKDAETLGQLDTPVINYQVTITDRFMDPANKDKIYDLLVRDPTAHRFAIYKMIYESWDNPIMNVEIAEHFGVSKVNVGERLQQTYQFLAETLFPEEVVGNCVRVHKATKSRNVK